MLKVFYKAADSANMSSGGKGIMFGAEGSYYLTGFPSLLIRVMWLRVSAAIVCRNYEIPKPVVDYRE